MTYDLHIGIDYSGAKTPTSRLPGLQVFAASGGGEPVKVVTPSALPGRRQNWTRREIAEWLIEQTDRRYIAGIDHAFSFPDSYFRRYGLEGWDAFLVDFVQHWPTYEDNMYVDFVREKGPARIGDNTEFRLTERWNSSAKSIFQFDVQGQVAKSTHAGIPWLHRVRQKAGDKIHFWPFDGWDVPEGKSVIVEVYPSIFRRRYDRAKRTIDEQDAYATARWLSEADGRGFLERYLRPPLTEQEQRVADQEGWILGVG